MTTTTPPTHTHTHTQICEGVACLHNSPTSVHVHKWNATLNMSVTVDEAQLIKNITTACHNFVTLLF